MDYVLGGECSGTSEKKPSESYVLEGQVRGLGIGSWPQPITDQQPSCLCVSDRHSVFPQLCWGPPEWWCPPDPELCL